MALTSIASVELDKEEYSRYEAERNTLLVTLSVVGTSLIGEEITLQLIKARRERDEVVATKTLTLGVDADHLAQEEFYLPDIVDENVASKTPRGRYFVRATSVTDENITEDSPDFLISLISVDRVKDEWLHGTELTSFETVFPVEQPQLINSVTIFEVSSGHAKGTFPLSYNYNVTAAPSLTSENGPFDLEDGQILVLSLNGSNTVTATFNTADFVDIDAATAAEVAAVINTDMEGVVASVSGAAVVIAGDLTVGTYSIILDPSTTATDLGYTGFSNAPVVRSLSWAGGPVQVLSQSKKEYVLQRGIRQGAVSSDYIKVRIGSFLQLPQQSHAENIVLDKKPFDSSRIRTIIENAISWAENVILHCYVEPTRITTKLSSSAIEYETGEDIPHFPGSNWDDIVNPVVFTKPSAGHWVGFKMPRQPVIVFEELYGQLGNTRIIDIDVSMIEHHEPTGWVELVPFSQSTLFNFIGLVWVESLRQPVPLPNFWNFTALCGFRETPAVIIEMITKRAAVDLLAVAGQAYRGGYSSQSISRDGVSESVQYTASAQFGIYSATMATLNDWLKENIPKIRGKFRGPQLTVL